MLASSEEQSGKLFPRLSLQECYSLFLMVEGSWAGLGIVQDPSDAWNE